MNKWKPQLHAVSNGNSPPSGLRPGRYREGLRIMKPVALRELESPPSGLEGLRIMKPVALRELESWMAAYVQYIEEASS